MNWRRNPTLNWRLYCIIDKNIIQGVPSRKMADALFRAGVDVVQLRYKNLPSYELVNIAKKIQKLATKYRKTLLINDRIDVARACGSKGVHLGNGDISVRTARLLLNRRSIIGKTVHNVKEVKKTNFEKPDYVSAGPIFSTPLKKQLKKQGTDFVRKIKRCVPVPVFAIGGINKRNIKTVFESGANGICVTRAIFKAKELLKEIKKPVPCEDSSGRENQKK